MLIGYARVSTDDQDLSRQTATLVAADCTKIYEEKIIGAKRDRPELARMIDHLREMDIVVITRLDRLARSTKNLLDIAEQLNERKAGVRSLAESWADTTLPAGRMVLTVFAGIAEFERALIHQRTSAGRPVAKTKGVRFGRPPALKSEKIALGQKLLDEGRTVRQVAKVLGVHPTTVYRVSRSVVPVG
jgi:DNA invertase Pin-like site-specific DNA recombinase